MMIETDGATLHVSEHGAAHRTLVFLHYWGGSGRTWIGVTTALGGQNHCLMPDLPGWGQSGPSRRGYRIADLAESVSGMIDAYRLHDVVLVGHSMGGKIAQYLAGQRPAWLKELVLVASSPALPMDVPESQRLAMQSAYDSRASVEETLDNVLTETPLAGMIRERAIADSLAGDPAAKAAWPAVAMLEDISETTQCINVPTLLLTAEYDRVDPPAVLADRLVPFLPTPEIQELAGVGHLLPLEAPKEVAGHIQRWLDELDNRVRR
ncbi:MAG: alpha/beta hydrolase [Salinicola sp.]|uniref:alpha/beta fold hydrolase n=1 Tax=Salinicola sp. TaxID=1978524 RepID=UPI001DAE10AB|nr:alpha/beta hydrolase [Salinicola sp.]NRB55594.1 alpha/beta hydrolase [Salinicola sp.]